MTADAIIRRLDRLEDRMRPKSPPVLVVVYEGDPLPDPMPEGARVILVRYEAAPEYPRPERDD